MHTPGPWKVEVSTKRGEFCWDYTIRSIDDSHICIVGPCSPQDNARLIAGAPELLEALENLLYEPMAERTVDAAKRAITKATGKDTTL